MTVPFVFPDNGWDTLSDLDKAMIKMNLMQKDMRILMLETILEQALRALEFYRHEDEIDVLLGGIEFIADHPAVHIITLIKTVLTGPEDND